MNYKNRLDSLTSIQSLAVTFNFLNKTLIDVISERDELLKQINNENKNLFSKIFQPALHNTRTNNLNKRIKRAKAIINIFEANPNKAKEKNITFSQLINRAINEVKNNLNEQEIKEVENLSSLRFYYGIGIDDIEIFPDLSTFYPQEYAEQAKALKSVHQNEPRSIEEDYQPN
jgi:hypothetical protein